LSGRECAAIGGHHANTLGTVFAQLLDEDGLAEQIAAEKHPVTNFVLLEMTAEISMGK
jgi:hypothetical protein